MEVFLKKRDFFIVQYYDYCRSTYEHDRESSRRYNAIYSKPVGGISYRNAEPVTPPIRNKKKRQ